MSSTSKAAESAPTHVEEERLIHALVSRGLVTREEVEECRKMRPESEVGIKELLTQLVKCSYLTVSQAKRTHKNLELLLQQQIPGFELMDKLGRGSMGTVFKARQLSMDRLVAIKILHPRLAANESYLKRFTREAHLAARFSSNNVVQAIDVGAAGTLHYFIMEYVEGTTVKEQLEKGKIYTEREALEIVVQIVQALDQAHQRQLIHRDVKPANLIITPGGVAKLADLGLARQLEDAELDKMEKGQIIGTPYYTAPEVIRSRPDVDIRADIYSLGATFYHMVTGRQPFLGEKVVDVLKAHLNEPLTPPDHVNRNLSSGLGEVVEFMMAKDRDQRYHTPADLLIDLQCLLHNQPPKIAGQKTGLSTLEELSRGRRVEEDDEDEDVAPAGSSFPYLPIMLLLVGLLVLSLIFNVVLLGR